LRAIIDATLFTAADREIALSVSIGVALCQSNVTCGLKEVLAESDAALYAAKQAGRNRVVCSGVENA
jgi:GGDEF domain-containing protein